MRDIISMHRLSTVAQPKRWAAVVVSLVLLSKKLFLKALFKENNLYVRVCPRSNAARDY